MPRTSNRGNANRYGEIKDKVCKLCETVYHPFSGDYITVKGKGYDEVIKTLKFAKEEDTELKGVDLSKYVFVVESNGDTLIKK